MRSLSGTPGERPSLQRTPTTRERKHHLILAAAALAILSRRRGLSAPWDPACKRRSGLSGAEGLVSAPWARRLLGWIQITSHADCSKPTQHRSQMWLHGERTGNTQIDVWLKRRFEQALFLAF